MVTTSATKILLENAKTLSERREIFALTEAEEIKVNNNMVTKLFNSALDKSHVNFDDIPNTKGDITRYSGYSALVSSIEQLRKIALNNGHKISEIDDVDKAISNIVANRNIFEKGFKLNKDFIILQYNTLVSACVMAVSTLIISYVEYIKRIDKVEFTILNNKYSAGDISIKSLQTFNKSVSNGDFGKVMNLIIRSGVNESVSITMEGPLGIIAGIAAGAVVLVMIIREIIFQLYYNRMKLSDYLALQAKFLELNKNNLLAAGNNMPAEKRNEIIKKQAKLIDTLHKLSDKLKVESTIAAKKAKAEMDKENSTFKLDTVKNDMASQDSSGFVIL